jgi:hypothetical protein
LLKGIKSPQVLWLFRIIVSVTVMNQYSAWWRMKYLEVGKYYIRASQYLLFAWHCYCDQVKDVEASETCSTHGGNWYVHDILLTIVIDNLSDSAAQGE